MLICIGNVIGGGDLATVRRRLDDIEWTDGARTAGQAARLVKRNEQASPNDQTAMDIKQQLSAAILRNEVFQIAVLPKTLSPLMISRYGLGMAYGTHVDNAMMGGLRSDVSFTLFLCEPDSYEGGSLVIEGPGGEQDFKLPAGSLVAYPSTSLHRVEPVTRGVRLAAVGWARSLVRSAERREILFDMETARRSLFAAHGKTRDYDLIAKSNSNLLRLWAED